MTEKERIIYTLISRGDFDFITELGNKGIEYYVKIENYESAAKLRDVLIKLKEDEKNYENIRMEIRERYKDRKISRFIMSSNRRYKRKRIL